MLGINASPSRVSETLPGRADEAQADLALETVDQMRQPRLRVAHMTSDVFEKLPRSTAVIKISSFCYPSRAPSSRFKVFHESLSYIYYNHAYNFFKPVV